MATAQQFELVLAALESRDEYSILPLSMEVIQAMDAVALELESRIVMPDIEQMLPLYN